MKFLNPEYSILFFIPLFSFLFYLAGEKKLWKLRSYFEGTSSGGSFRFSISRILILLGITLAVPAMMRPVANPREHSVKLKGRDIVFLVDVSRSMLAGDLIPNRLDRTRFDIQSAMDELYGNRVALVAFAGDAVLKCPLTTDYGYFIQTVRDLSVHSVTRGGSSIGDAIRFTIKQFYREDSGSSLDIILITDGEDQNTFPLEAAGKAGELGIPIVAIGLGNSNQGAAVPDTEYQGQQVYSVADSESLKGIAERSSGGWFLPVAKGAIDFSGVVKQLGREKQIQGEDRYISYTEYFLLFLIPSLFCIFFGIFPVHRVFKYLAALHVIKRKKYENK